MTHIIKLGKQEVLYEKNFSKKNISVRSGSYMYV